MSQARSDIMARIRASLKVGANDAARLRAAETRIAAHSRQLVPSRATGAAEDLALLMQSFLQGQMASVIAAADARSVPSVVHGYLKDMGLAPALRLGGDARLRAMPWEGESGLHVTHGAAVPEDPTGVSFALCGIAETGTLVVAAGGDNPVTLAFLPATHIIVVDRDTIVGSYEEAIELVRRTFGPSGMPRTLNYISGPSRTADIGGKIVIGAHGPRNLCVVIVG